MLLAAGNTLKILNWGRMPWGERSPKLRSSSSSLTLETTASPPPLKVRRLVSKLAAAEMSSSSSSDPIEYDGEGSSVVASMIPPGFAEVVVVRHGETSWNASKIIQGHLDAELNELGRKQASAVAGRLSKESRIAAIYSSDLKRAYETAQIIAAACYLPEVVKDPALRERHIGDLQGLTLRDAAKLKPMSYKILMSHNRNQEIPGGGESHNQLYRRCTSSLEGIARKHIGGRVIVVSHGGTIRELYRRACPTGSPQGRIQNTAVSVFHISEGGEDWIMKQWGDVSHLQEIEVLEDSFGGDGTSA